MPYNLLLVLNRIPQNQPQAAVLEAAAAADTQVASLREQLAALQREREAAAAAAEGELASLRERLRQAEQAGEAAVAEARGAADAQVSALRRQLEEAEAERHRGGELAGQVEALQHQASRVTWHKGWGKAPAAPGACAFLAPSTLHCLPSAPACS